jgi:hypothetical protein
MNRQNQQTCNHSRWYRRAALPPLPEVSVQKLTCPATPAIVIQMNRTTTARPVRLHIMIVSRGKENETYLQHGPRWHTCTGEPQSHCEVQCSKVTLYESERAQTSLGERKREQLGERERDDEPLRQRGNDRGSEHRRAIGRLFVLLLFLQKQKPLVPGALGSLMPVVFHSRIGAKCSGGSV